MAVDSQFYVYAYLRAQVSEHGDAGTPYYIGKGHNDRRFQSIRRHRPPSDPNLNVLLSEGLTEEQAHQEEIRLIKQYGRIDLGTGCLRNMTDGGEGVSGRITTPQTLQKLRAAKLGGSASPTARSNMRKAQLGKTQSTATKNKRALALSGVTRPPEVRAKIKRSRLGQKKSAQAVENSRQAHVGLTHSASSCIKMSTAQQNRRLMERMARQALEAQ